MLRSMISFKTSLLSTVLCVGLTSIVFAGCGDHRESFYPTLADADKDGAITRGWLPDDLLPGSSRAVHELHEISPSTEWCAFEFLPTDSLALRKNVGGVDALPSSVRHVPSPDASCWPAVLNGNLDVEQITRPGSNFTPLKDPRPL